MKTFRMIGMALVAVVLGFAMSSCENDDDVDPYKDYPQLIVGKWFNFTPEASGFIDFQADGTYKEVGYNNKIGWTESAGSYRFDGNRLINTMSNSKEYSNIVEITREKLIYKAGGNPEHPEFGEIILYSAKESFDIKGNYTYLNSAVRVEPAAGKTALQLPEGFLFNGENTIPVESLNGERIIDASKAFFADATFAEDGKLNHTMNGEVKVKNYTLNGNNLVFNLYEGSDTYKVNATSFPDEDGDRLFIIIPKQAAWLGGMVDLIEKENEGLKLDAAQIAALEKEFMDTFETFTVILSLSKK
ncbi:MAG: hypothetical protein E7130_01675 [Rikenellaceae bacterium]|nr:hypothetical protein [Rikenellaceae bacterium]